MQNERLREFVVFSQYLNFSVAAKKLFISQPALSSHIASLERELGVLLVNRDTSMSLTNAGCELVACGSELLKQYENLFARVRTAGKNELKLTVAINEVGTAAGENWGIFWARFISEHCKVYVTVDECEDSTVRSALKDGKADCVVVFDCPIESDVEQGIEFRELPNFTGGRLCLWIDESHPLASLSELHWADMDELSHPLPNKQARLWASTVKELLKTHGVKLHSRMIEETGLTFYQRIKPDEVQLFDTGFADKYYLRSFPHRFLKPIDEPDAESLAFLAYNPKRVSAELHMMLNFLKTCKDEHLIDQLHA